MATLYIWYHRAPAQGTYGEQNLVDEPYKSKETVTTSSTPASSNAAPAEVSVARVYTDTETYYYVRRGDDTTEVAVTDGRIPADEEKDIAVKPGDVLRVRTA